MFRRDHAADDGQATTILLCCMVVAVLAITMLLMRIGHADDLRTRARQASDAAALAASSTVRDRAIAMIKTERIAPSYVVIAQDGEQAASDYAHRNGSVVTDYQGGGTSAKVTVRTQECIQKETGGAKYQAEKPCVRTDTDKGQDQNGERSATASSAAAVDLPPCQEAFYEPPRNGQYVSCQVHGVWRDVTTYSWSDLADLFKVHLTDTFNPTIPISPFAAGGGPVPDLPPATTAEAKANEDTGKKLARDLKGWTDEADGGGESQWHCLDQLWLHESGWNHHAKNSGSGAYGIPQALPAGKMATAGSDWATNASTQIRWGLDYIAGRYGNPCNAWHQWQARDPHWY